MPTRPPTHFQRTDGSRTNSRQSRDCRGNSAIRRAAAVLSGLDTGRHRWGWAGILYEFESHFRSEQVLVKATGRHGRADLLLWAEKDHSDVVVIETMNTDWDTLASRNTAKRNLDRHRRQLWSYIDGSVPIEAGTNEPLDLQSADRQIGVVYPRTPVTPGLREQIVEKSATS